MTSTWTATSWSCRFIQQDITGQFVFIPVLLLFQFASNLNISPKNDKLMRIFFRNHEKYACESFTHDRSPSRYVTSLEVLSDFYPLPLVGHQTPPPNIVPFNVHIFSLMPLSRAQVSKLRPWQPGDLDVAQRLQQTLPRLLRHTQVVGPGFGTCFLVTVVDGLHER